MPNLTTEQRFQNFKQKAIQKYGSIYDYSKSVYIRNDVKIEIGCHCGNYFFQTPANHLTGFNGCKLCRDSLIRKNLGHTREKFIADSEKIHKSKYDYSKVIYENWESMVIIGCPYHGDFVQQANSHKQGTGCPTCSRYKTSRLGGMSNIKGLDDELVHLYVVTFKSDKYEFVKVGLTSRTVEKRFNRPAYHVYEKVVLLDCLLPSKDAIKLESDCLKTFYEKRYYIKDKVDTFKGCTELFNISVKEDLVKYVKDTISSSHERTCVET